jgi:hypothetical protein
MFCLLAVVVAAGFVGYRVWDLYRTASGGYRHLRYLLESGETVEGAPADDVLSDNYLRSLFGDNPDLVEQLKSVVDLGMATDANLRLGNIAAMLVTYRKAGDEIRDPAIYAIGGFPDPKSERLGFHGTGYFAQEFDPAMWNFGNSLVHLLGRDIVIFCEQDKAESHMALLFDLLHGDIVTLAKRIVEAPLYYAIVFPEPGEVAPPNIKNALQTVLVRGSMEGDKGVCDWMFICPDVRSAGHVETLCRDTIALARATFHDKYGGYIKEMPWGKMNDNWWATEYVDLIDAYTIKVEQKIVRAHAKQNRRQNNAILKTVERLCRDLAAQKAFYAGELPWQLAFSQKDSSTAGHWSKEHMEGPDWPLGTLGVPTPGSIAEEEEKARIKAEQEAEKARREQEQAQPQPAAESTDA